MSGKTFDSIFKGKQNELEKKIDTGSDLLSKLEADDVITTRQRTDIEVTVVTAYSFKAVLCMTLLCRIIKSKLQFKLISAHKVYTFDCTRSDKLNSTEIYSIHSAE